MNDFIDRRSPNRVRAQLEAARTAGAWMPWAGAALAALLWGGIGVWLVASLGIDGLMKQSPLVMAGGFATVLSTGLALICAGIMAREGARSAEANQIVLTSARLLLEPAESTRGEVATLAEALADTRQRFDILKRDIEASVTGALKAAEIVRTLHAAGWRIALPQGNEMEQTRAEMIAAGLQFEKAFHVDVWPSLGLDATVQASDSGVITTPARVSSPDRHESGRLDHFSGCARQHLEGHEDSTGLNPCCEADTGTFRRVPMTRAAAMS